MAVVDITTLKSYFETGDTPTQGQFTDLIDTLFALRLGTALLSGNNLDDLASISTALTNLGLNNVDNTSDLSKPISTAQALINSTLQTNIDAKQDDLGYTAENAANKDASGGYAGLTLFKINFKNALNTFTSFFTNSNTAARTYTFKDRNGTIADDTDLAGKQDSLATTAITQITWTTEDGRTVTMTIDGTNGIKIT